MRKTAHSGGLTQEKLIHYVEDVIIVTVADHFHNLGLQIINHLHHSFVAVLYIQKLWAHNAKSCV